MLQPNRATFLGSHIILDVWTEELKYLTNVKLMEDLLSSAAKIACATILSSNFHEFGEGFGITGVLVLAESHISVHTWPEYNYAALDIFMCGNSEPKEAVRFICDRLKVTKSSTQEILRGIEKES